MKFVVTHTSPDLDAITSVWLIKRFFPGWNTCQVAFVSAGEMSDRVQNKEEMRKQIIYSVGNDELIHVDTGLGMFDHHQTADDTVCGASLTWEYVKQYIDAKKHTDKIAAISRIVSIVVEGDHFKEVFWPNPNADYYEFSLMGILEGLKLQKPNEDLLYVDFIMTCLDALLHNFENKQWAENEIETKGILFQTKWGKGIGFDTINDSVIKLAQKMGYMVVIRKDPRKGYVRIKARPTQKGDTPIDLTLVYEQLAKMDPQATWFLHVSKKMLLNGTPKNPKMRPTTLTLKEIIKVVEKV